MYKYFFYVILAFSMAIAAPCPAYAQAALIERLVPIRDSLVTVQTLLTRKKPQTSQITNYTRNAAGIILNPKGLIVVNTHTIAHAPRIFVTLADGTKKEARIVASSPKFDFSFLKITPPYALKPIRWADSDRLSLGETIITINNSKKHKNTFSEGKVTGFVDSKNTPHRVGMIQLNINLYRGDSGGPVLNTQGRLLGLISGKQNSVEAASFAIASNIIRDEYLKYSKKHGH